MPETAKLFDTITLIETHHADKDFIKHMITLFVKNIPESNANLEKACKEKNWERVYFNAHKMKASIDLFNLNPLKDLIRKLELKAKNNEKSKAEVDIIDDDVNFISSYVKDCVADMKREYKL